MKVIGVIPARYSSSRFPGKPLVDLKGKTMIQRVFEGASKSSKIDRIIVATDDQRIYDEVVSFGGEVVMTSKSHSTGTDRCGEVAKIIGDFDVLINIQGDEPLVDFRQLDQLVDVFKDEEVNIATLGHKKVDLEDVLNTNRIKIVTDFQSNALYFSRSSIPNYSNIKENPLEVYPYLRHIGLYAFRKDTLLKIIALDQTKLERIESLEQLRWLYYGFSIKVVETEIETPNIDVPDDVANVLKYL